MGGTSTVVVGRDFNAAPLPMDCGFQDRYKECPGLLHLLSHGGLRDSFRLVNPNALEFSWMRLVKRKYIGARWGLEALSGEIMDHVMSYLPVTDKSLMTSTRDTAGWWWYKSTLTSCL